MGTTAAIIGFGEAGRAFAGAFPGGNDVRAYDRKTDDPIAAPVKWADYAAAGVTGTGEARAALAGAAVVLSLVTADQALAAASACAPLLDRDCLWCDMNSVAPQTKRAAAEAVEAAGGRYVDVAVMSPVHPSRVAVPLLVSGPWAEEGAEALRNLGFTRVRVVPGAVGRASSIKMIRSVMVKGIEALTAECVFAASRAGVLDEVLASLDASPPAAGWHERADYNLDRMMVHGLRRAAEMEEVVRTLDDLRTGSVMTRGTVARQHEVGSLGMTTPPKGLEAKLSALDPLEKADA